MRTAGPYVVAVSWKDRPSSRISGSSVKAARFRTRSRGSGRGGGRRRPRRWRAGAAAAPANGRRAGRPGAQARRARRGGSRQGAVRRGGGEGAAPAGRGRGRGGRGGGGPASSRCLSPATRSRAAAAGRRRWSRWAWDSSISSATPRCCATSASTGRWNCRAGCYNIFFRIIFAEPITNNKRNK